LSGPVHLAARFVATTLLVLLLLVLGAVAALYWWTGTQHSLDWAIARFTPALGVSVDGARGSLRTGATADAVNWEGEGLRARLTGVDVGWHWRALLERRLHLSHLRAQGLEVIDERPPSQDERTERAPPAQATLPLPVQIDEVQVGRITLRGNTGFEASELAGSYRYEDAQHAASVSRLVVPQGHLSGELRLGAQAPMALDLRLQGEAAAALPGGQRSLPLVVQASAQGELADFRLEVQITGMPAGDKAPSGTLTARVMPWADMPLPQARARFDRIDLASLLPQAPRTLLSGHAAVVPESAGGWRVETQIANANPGPWDRGLLPLERLVADGQWLASGAAVVRRFQARLGGGEASGSGRWVAQDSWRLDGRVRDVDPARLHTALAPLPLSGPLQARTQGKVLHFEVDLAARAGADRATGLQLRQIVANGRWAQGEATLDRVLVRSADATLQGHATVIPSASFAQGSLTLEAPGLKADAVGSLAERRGGGTLRLEVPRIAQALAWVARLPGTEGITLPALQGEAFAVLDWQGGWRDPGVRGQVQLPRVVLPGAPGTPAWVVRRTTLAIDGRLSAADLQLQGELVQATRRLQLDLRGTGGQVAPSSWQARIDTLEADALDTARMPGEWQLRLQGAPVDVRVRTDGGLLVQAGGGRAVLAAPVRSGPGQAQLTWEPLRWGRGQTVVAGRLSGLPLSWVELFGPRVLAGTPLTGNLIFDAAWDLRLADTLQLRASLARTAGDLQVTADALDGTTVRVPAGIREASLLLEGRGENMTASLRWDSERAGSATGRVSTRLARDGTSGWQWRADAPLAGRLEAQLPRLGVWSALAPPGWRLRGSLQADVTVGGTRSDPQLGGRFTADDLALRSVVDGISLQDGRLRARLDGQRVLLDELLLHGMGGAASGGSVRATGEAGWVRAGIQLRVDAQLERLRASVRSDRQLTVSGRAQAVMNADAATRVAGTLRVDRARILLPEEAAPRLSDDVVVRNLPEGVVLRQPRSANGARPVSIDVAVDLGDDFRVSGRGADVRLAGRVQATGTSLTDPRLVGLVRAGGRYTAFGQRLDIDRGELRFTGPADNPALDIVAIRPTVTQTQRVGVQVSGTAQSPVVRLYSEPQLPEAQALSWLVLGRPAAEGGAEAALVQRAALALLTQGTGGSQGPGLAQRFGLDELSVRRDGVDGAAITLGRRFADNFYAAYERSLAGAIGTLFVYYQLTQRLTVRAEAGDRSGVDLIYSFSFD
jgi:translocation and assembly module TamB